MTGQGEEGAALKDAFTVDLHLIAGCLSYSTHIDGERVRLAFEALRSDHAALTAERDALRGERDREFNARITMEFERDAALGLLKELAARVRGECPQILDEDRGGDARLSLSIDGMVGGRE